jgi:hypothetical protein
MITYTIYMQFICESFNIYIYIYIYMESLDELVQCTHYLISIHTLLYENN